MNKEEYIKKWIEGTLTQEERAAFEKTDDYHHLEKLSNAMKAFKAPEFDTETEAQRLKLRRGQPEAKVTHVNWLSPLFKVAAVFIVVVGIYFYFFYSSNVTVETSVAEKTQIMLPDSSLVMLNALSSISYDKRNWEENRKVELNGEAFFKVQKGSRFDVETSSGVITVLGTQFNVISRIGYFEVVCYEGLVQVTAEGHQAKLSKKYMFRVVHGKLVEDIDVNAGAPAWLSNESSFESVPFGEVLDEFERQYNVTITAENVDLNQIFTGRFTHADMSLALKSIAYPLNLEYEIVEDKRIILKGNSE